MNKKGFTLVEILIAMFVGLVIMAAVYGLMTFAQKTSSSLDRKVITQQDTRSVLDLMAMEIRMASYNMRSEADLWLNSPTCWGIAVPAPDPYYGYVRKGILQANANQLAFVMDLDSDRQFTSNNEYIRYSYDNMTNTLTRSAMMNGGACGAAQDILGGTAPFTNVRNATAGVKMFRYFNSANTDITNTVNNNNDKSTGIPAIRRILITIVTETEQPDSNTHQPKRMVYSTSVIVRNHVLSPPNYPK